MELYSLHPSFLFHSNMGCPKLGVLFEASTEFFFLCKTIPCVLENVVKLNAFMVFSIIGFECMGFSCWVMDLPEGDGSRSS